MKTPEHLSHKPILKVDDYDQLDGQYVHNTDTKALSIGRAQYDKNEVSAKIWRHVKGKWSRQSEELPLHRVLDLANLLMAAFLKDRADTYPTTRMGEQYVNNTKRDTFLLSYLQNNLHHLLARIQELNCLTGQILNNQ